MELPTIIHPINSILSAFYPFFSLLLTFHLYAYNETRPVAVAQVMDFDKHLVP